MNIYLAVFPIVGPTSPERLHREALAQLPDLIPDDVDITGEWRGHTRTDPNGRPWWVMTAPATGAVDVARIETLQQAAHRLDPALAAWIRHQTLAAPTTTATRRPARRPHTRYGNAPQRLEDLEDLITAGTPVEHALTRIGWTPGAAAIAARRHGRHDLATLCGQGAKPFIPAA